MMNQSASATRRPSGSAATAGCCPMLVHPQFFVNPFSAHAPHLQPPPQSAGLNQQCLLGSQSTQLQLPPTANAAHVSQPTNATIGAGNLTTTTGQHQTNQASRQDHSNYNTSISAHNLPLQHLLSSRDPASNCMALAAALASASFHQHQQLQQAHQQTPINHSQQSTNAANTSPTTHTNNQVPILNFNSYTAAQPFLNIPAPAPLSAHLNLSNNHQPQQQQQQPSEPVTLQPQQQPQQQQPQPIPPIPFYSFPQMEQALALLTNPQVANNLFSHVFNIYLQGGLRTEPHHTHHHHHPPHHYHHHLHGSHHHHHHHHGPNGQNNGQDDTMLTISESKPRGLNRAEIDSLTPYIQMNEKDSRSCVICLSKFELKSKIRPLPCNHAFHAKCVDKWLRANRTCPICRRDALKTYGAKIKRI